MTEKAIRDGLLMTAAFTPKNARRAAQKRLDQINQWVAKAKFLAPDLYDVETPVCHRYRFSAGVVKNVVVPANYIKAQADTIDELREKLGIPLSPGAGDRVIDKTLDVEDEYPEPDEPDDGSRCSDCRVPLTDDNAPKTGSTCYDCLPL